jgi:predicted aldo/keto reductase-like oxidoreductase
MNMSKILIGAMRFHDRKSAVTTVREAIDCGFNYIDTSACYCFQSEEENSEAWVGEAVNYKNYRDRVMVAAKCTAGNGGMGLGDFIQQRGFGVRSVEQLKQVFEQSLRRQKLEKFDYYHMWTTHTMEQFNEAMKPGGWYEGVMAMSDYWDHLGITTHADNDIIINFLETGKFETVTLPLNVINTTRMKAVEYCREKGIKVIAMNPFAGGFLAAHEELKELAIHYLLSLDNVYPLVGFSEVEHVHYAKQALDDHSKKNYDTRAILQRVDELINSEEARCTACGYCQPCPKNINVGAALSYYNLFKYMGIKDAKTAFQNKQWEDGLRLDRCTECGLCEKRCPNGLQVRKIINDARKLMYDPDKNK